jgi:RNA polymerase sigma factor (sigma-70 family)
VYGLFLRQLGDVELSTDLTAETFAQALAGVDRFRGGTSEEARGWLYGIARNLLRGYLRSRRVERQARMRLGMPERDYSDDDAGWERLPGVQEAIAELSDAERAALVLRVIDELPYTEIGARLGIEPVTARMRVSRALRTLQHRLRGVPE